MAQGILGKADLAATTNTLLATIAQEVETVNITFCNRNATASTVRLYIGTGGSPTNTDALVYGASIAGNGNIEFTGIPCSNGEKIWAWASTTLVTACARGL